MDSYSGRRIASVGAYLKGTIVLGALMAFAPLAAWFDIQVLGNKIQELSVVEISQALMLVLSIACFSILAIRSRTDRTFAVLAAALFGTLLIRELDQLFDLISHGFWKYPVTLVLLAATAWWLHDRRGVIAGFHRFVISNASGLMMAGFVLVMVYSRLIGMGAIWSGIMEDQFLRVIKNAVEESAELLGYTLLSAASLRYLALRRHTARQAWRGWS